MADEIQEGPEPSAGESARPGVRDDGNREAVYEIPVEVTAVLGTATLRVSQLLKLGRGAVVQLDRMVDDAIEIHANNKLVARGDVVVVDDHLGVNLTEIIRRAIGL